MSKSVKRFSSVFCRCVGDTGKHRQKQRRQDHTQTNNLHHIPCGSGAGEAHFACGNGGGEAHFACGHGGGDAHLRGGHITTCGVGMQTRNDTHITAHNHQTGIRPQAYKQLFVYWSPFCGYSLLQNARPSDHARPHAPSSCSGSAPVL